MNDVNLSVIEVFVEFALFYIMNVVSKSNIRKIIKFSTLITISLNLTWLT